MLPAGSAPRRSLSTMRLLRRFLLALLVLILMPLGAHAAWWMAHDHPASWSAARWSSTGMLPAAKALPEAQVLVFAARTGRWKGIFAHHSWIVLKPAGATDYIRYDKVGWGSPVRRNGSNSVAIGAVLGWRFHAVRFDGHGALPPLG